VLRTRLILDRAGSARQLRGVLDLAVRIATPAAVADRLPARVARALPRDLRQPTIWIGAADHARPRVGRDGGAPWPRGTRAWAIGTIGAAPLWRVVGEAPALTRLLRWLAADPLGRHRRVTAVAVAGGRVWTWTPDDQGTTGWRVAPAAAAPPPRARDAVRGLHRLLASRGAPPPRVVLPDGLPATVVAAATNLVARLALASDRFRSGPIGLSPREPAARAAELVLVAGGSGPARLRLGSRGEAVLSGGRDPAQLLQRLARVDPFAVEDPLEWLGDRVRWPGAATRPQRPRRPPTAERVRVSGPWEGDVILRAAAALRGRPGSVRPLAVDCCASEDPGGRGRLAAAVAGALAIPSHRVRPLPAYHQAAVWLQGEAATALVGSGATTLHLGVPRGAPERPASWAITALGGLERLAATLGLAEESVTVAVARAATASAPTFRLTAATPAGPRRLTFRPLTVPGGAWPGDRSETSGLRLHLPGGGVREVPVESDHAACVRLYEAEVLPLALERARGGRTVRVELTVTTSEPDGEDGLGQFSPLEELHEELYFRTHAAARAVRARLVLVPEVLAAPGDGVAITARMVDLGGAGQAVLEPEPTLLGLRCPAAGRSGLELEVGWGRGGRPDRRPRPGDAVRPTGRSGRWWWWWSARAGGRAPGPGAGRGDPARLPVPELVPAAALRLRGQEGCTGWIAGRSTLGRPIAAVAALPWPGRVGSVAKAALLCPTVLLVGGHHANEVSSTGAHLALIEALHAGWRPDAVLVCVPLENPDGAVVHRQLALAHPTWKLHAARFNGVGEEFGGQPRPLRSPFGEARPRARLLAAIGADCLVDDHGVPDHVWAQPLCGRSSPPYFPIAYTLPPGLLYVIGETGADGSAPTGWTAAVHAAIAASFLADPELVRRHRALWQAYRRYGSDLDPRAFPSREVDGLPLQARRVATGDRRRVADRFPIALDLVTEVADETSRGEDLALAVRAHLRADRAILAEVARAAAPAAWVGAPAGWRLRRDAACVPAAPPAPAESGAGGRAQLSRRRSSSPG